MANYSHNEAFELEDGSVITIYDMSEEQLAQYDIHLIGPARQQYNSLHPKEEVSDDEYAEIQASDNSIPNPLDEPPTQNVTPDADEQLDLTPDPDFEEGQLPNEDEIIQTLETEFDRQRKGVDVDNGFDTLMLEFPDYGYDRYVTDIANWQKQRSTLGGDPGAFYFKVFFNFNTNYGLLGGALQTINNRQTSTEPDETSMLNQLKSTNTALGYLCTLAGNYMVDLIPDRLLALSKFIISLKNISLRTPWMIKSVSGLNTINGSGTKDFDKERSITLTFSEDSVDARFGTMLDLYKFSCFDQINCREIIPVNLRKFEMSIMVYQMPLKYYHTKVMTSKDNSRKNTSANFFKGIMGVGEDLEFDGVLDAKTTTLGSSTTNNFGDLMSFKLFTFLNCEIDTENINEYYIDGMSNEAPFKLGNNGIKIRYDRVYEHRMNEWIEAMFGSDGFQFNNVIPENLKNLERSKYLDTPEKNIMLMNSTDSPNSPDSAISQYRQRAEALRNKWYGKTSIVEYTDLLIAKYYRPNHFHVPGTSLQDLGNSLSNMYGGKKWGKVMNNMRTNYSNFKSGMQTVGNSISGFFNMKP